MLDLGGEDDVAGLLLNDGNTSHLRSRVNLDTVLVNDRFLKRSILEDDGEREAPEDSRAAFAEQFPGPRRMARIQWFPVLVQHEDPHV